MKKKIHIKKSHEGRFTQWAKEHHMSVSEAAHHVMAHQGDYSSHVVSMANFAKNFGKKKADGGPYIDDKGLVNGADPRYVTQADTDALGLGDPSNPQNQQGQQQPGPSAFNAALRKFAIGASNFAGGYLNQLANPFSIANGLNSMDMLGNTINNIQQNHYMKNYLRDHMTSDQVFSVVDGSQSGMRGDYNVTGSAYGMFRPDQLGAKSPYGMFNGKYYPKQEKGGELPKAAAGYVADELSYTPSFMGNTSTTAPVNPEIPGMHLPASPMTYPGFNSNPNVSVNERTKEAYNYYVKDKGLPSHIAAGIIGNLYQESGLKPTAIQQGGAGRGLAQWDVNGRWQGFLNWAKENNRDPYDTKSQLDYVLVEPGEGTKALDRLKNTSTAEQAAYVFGKLYERPNEKAANWSNRTSIAAKLASGTYEQGGEYEMTDDELQQFLKSGGEVEFL
jgi:hypothetical protein